MMEEELDLLLDALSLVEYRVDAVDLKKHTIGDLIELKKELFRLRDRYANLDKRSDIVRRRLNRLSNRYATAQHDLNVRLGLEVAEDE